MARLKAQLAWFFSSLGVVLLGVSILVVPSNAFADPSFPPGAGISCEDHCGAYCLGNPSDPDCANNGAPCIAHCCAAVAISCLPSSCQTEDDACTDDCYLKPCNDGGKDPALNKCRSAANGCLCTANS